MPPQSSAISSSDFDTSEGTEEYAVYSHLLKELYVKDGVELLMIQKQTISAANHYLMSTFFEVPISEMKKLTPSASEDAFRDYRSKNQQPSILDPGFNLPVKYMFIEEAELKELNESEWEGWRTGKYSGGRGILRLTKVGFNKDRTEALVYVEFICPLLCGGGGNVLLEKHSGAWRVKERFDVWKS
jgi:hypothetical protein